MVRRISGILLRLDLFPVAFSKELHLAKVLKCFNSFHCVTTFAYRLSDNCQNPVISFSEDLVAVFT
jgi:hypothetical protein